MDCITWSLDLLFLYVIMMEKFLVHIVETRNKCKRFVVSWLKFFFYKLTFEITNLVLSHFNCSFYSLKTIDAETFDECNIEQSSNLNLKNRSKEMLCWKITIKKHQQSWKKKIYSALFINKYWYKVQAHMGMYDVLNLTTPCCTILLHLK